MEAEDNLPSGASLVFYRSAREEHKGNAMVGRRGAETQKNAVYTTKDVKNTKKRRRLR